MPDPIDDTPANEKDNRVMHSDLFNVNVKKAQYAVRGELYLRAEELRKAGKEIIFTNGKACRRPRRMLAYCATAWLTKLTPCP
jgi:glutamate--glyoxylate aminotransferase